MENLDLVFMITCTGNDQYYILEDNLNKGNYLICTVDQAIELINRNLINRYYISSNNANPHYTRKNPLTNYRAINIVSFKNKLNKAVEQYECRVGKLSKLHTKYEAYKDDPRKIEIVGYLTRRNNYLIGYRLKQCNKMMDVTDIPKLKSVIHNNGDMFSNALVDRYNNIAITNKFIPNITIRDNEAGVTRTVHDMLGVNGVKYKYTSAGYKTNELNVQLESYTEGLEIPPFLVHVNGKLVTSMNNFLDSDNFNKTEPCEIDLNNIDSTNIKSIKKAFLLGSNYSIRIDNFNNRQLEHEHRVLNTESDIFFQVHRMIAFINNVNNSNSHIKICIGYGRDGNYTFNKDMYEIIGISEY